MTGQTEAEQTVSAERIVIGAMMLQPAIIDDVMQLLTSSDFHHPPHRTIFATISDNASDGYPADPVAISIALEKRGELEKCGGGPYLHTCIDSVPAVASATWYARRVAESALARRYVAVATRISHAATSGDTESAARIIAEEAESSGSPDGRDRRAAAEVARELERQRVRRDARRLLDAEEAEEIDVPDPTFLSDLLDEEDEEARWRVEGVWPSGGNVLLSAGAKSGKTTTTGNIVRSLVDGDRLFGVYPTTPVSDGIVAVLDYEMPRGSVKRWLRDQGIRNTGLVVVWTERGFAGRFDLRNRAVRTKWVEKLKENHVKTWIIDCLSPVCSALGINENDNTEVGRLLDGITSASAEAGIDEVMVIHHMGHGAERSRGASRLIGWPDVNWRILRKRDEANPNADVDPDSPRYFSALGRDVDVREGRLIYDSATRHLTYAEGGRKSDNHSDAMSRLLVYVRDNPGLSGDAIEKKLTQAQGVGRNEARAALRDARTKGYVAVDMRGKAQLHRISAAGRSALIVLSGGAPDEVVEVRSCSVCGADGVISGDSCRPCQIEVDGR